MRNMLKYCKSSSFLFTFTSVLGLLSGKILGELGILVNEEGIQYYAQVHQSMHNSIIHTIFMPFTVYGISCWIPAFFGIIFGKWFDTYHKTRLQKMVWLWYILHYATIDLFVAYITIAWYMIACASAYEKVARGYTSIGKWFSELFCMNKLSHETVISNSRLFVHGFIWMTISLVIQEVWGHWYGGDDPSRVEGIPNAILYAGIYPMWHVIKGIPSM